MNTHARIVLEIELNQAQHEARHQNNTLQAWLFANANAVRDGREPSTSASAIAYQTGLVKKANARIVELTQQKTESKTD